MKILISALFVLFSSMATAQVLDCGYATIDKLYVQGERSDNSIHQNSMVIILGSDKSSACSGVLYAQVKNNKPEYQGILSLAMAAKFASKKVRLMVKTPGVQATHEIEIINVE